MNRLTRDCGPEPAPVPRSDWIVTRHELRSRSVPDPVRYVVARPPGGGDLPVVICLPGRGDVASIIVDTYRIQDIVAATVGPKFAVAAVDGGDTYWHRRASGEDRLAMLLGEVLPRLKHDHLGGSGAGIGLWGWSMGGYGCLRALMEAPDEFDAVATGGAALVTSPDATRPGAFDNAADFHRNDIFPNVDRLTAPIFLACGTSDPFIDGNRELATRLPTPPQTDFSAGCHDNRFWRRAAVAQSRFLASHLPGPDRDAAG